MTKLRELLSDESKWTKLTMARDAENNCVPLASSEACKFCLVGALDKLDISISEYNAKRAKIVGYIKKLPGADILYASPGIGSAPAVYSLIKFNDFNSWETIDTMLDELGV